jgi:hypothetical protein
MLIGQAFPLGIAIVIYILPQADHKPNHFAAPGRTDKKNPLFIGVLGSFCF